MFLALLATISLLPIVAHAGSPQGDPPRPNEHEHEHDPPLPPGDRERPMPAYQGKPRARSAGEVALWVPRVALFPMYLVSEFGVRRPVRATVTWAERHHLRERWNEFFTFDEEQKIGLFPTGSLDLGLRPRVGLYFFWLEAFDESDVKLRLTTGGLDAWTLNTLLEARLSSRDLLRWTFDYARHPDSVFYGLGRDVRDQAARFQQEHHTGRFAYKWQRDELSVVAAAGYLAASFDPRHAELGDESLADAIAAGELKAPPALLDGVVAVYTGVSGRFDTRPARLVSVESPRDLEPRSGSGFSAALHAGHYAGLATTRASATDAPRLPHWLRYGGSLVGVLDLTATERLLQLETIVEFAEPLPNDNPIPFTEQVSLGGSYPLRAFGGGHLIDESAAVATLSYGWPIWSSLDGNLHYSVGNVFPKHLSGFEPSRLRSSFGLGMQSVGAPDHPFEMLIAFGTKPFSEGGAIETVRFVVGTRAGF